MPKNNIFLFFPPYLTILQANNKSTEEPAHPRSLISALCYLFLETTIVKHALCKIAMFQLVSVAEQVGLYLAMQKYHNRFLLTMSMLKLN